MTTVKKALYIGGHGKIGLLSAPLISEKGYEIHSHGITGAYHHAWLILYF